MAVQMHNVPVVIVFTERRQVLFKNVCDKTVNSNFIKFDPVVHDLFSILYGKVGRICKALLLISKDNSVLRKSILQLFVLGAELVNFLMAQNFYLKE
jgi:hypothetical protein